MKRFVQIALFVTLAVSPMFASKKATVQIPENCAVGSTQIAAGEYKLTYDGTGPMVKVTLAKSGTEPILLDAKLLPTGSGRASVTFIMGDGTRLLKNIDLSKVTLQFENVESQGQ